MGHANYVELLTCLVDRPQPYPHPVTGLVTAAMHVRLGPQGQTVRVEVPPIGEDDAMARTVLGLGPGTHVHLRGRLATRAFTHAFWERVRYCPVCGEPYASTEPHVAHSRELVGCAACGSELTVARRRVHTLVVATELAELPGPPRRRLPRGSLHTSTVVLLGVVAGPVISALHRQTGLVESRFPLVVYRPGGPDAGKDYPWVYVLPREGRDGLARSVRQLQAGDPVLVHGQLRARRVLERNQVRDLPVRFCPVCRACLEGAVPERLPQEERIACPTCRSVVPVSYRSTVVEVVASGVEFLRRVQEYTYLPALEATP